MHPQRLQPPKEFQGKPPFLLKSGNKSFKILSVSPTGVNKKIYLIIRQEISAWKEDKEADGKNRELFAEFAKTFPEYKDVFSGVVIQAVEEGGSRGYGTVVEN